MRLTEDGIKDVADAIRRTGYAVVPWFLDATDIALLAGECRRRESDGDMTTASIGRGAERGEHVNIRGDKTDWFDANHLSSDQETYWNAMEVLRGGLNRELLLGLDELEAHFAIYPVGARYAKHRDRFRDDDRRVLSSVLYLNADWLEDQGGALRLYIDGADDLDVYPSAGTLVLFLSADFDHEVLPATRDRLSIAGWFRRRA
jgi:SM-20-related protein